MIITQMKKFIFIILFFFTSNLLFAYTKSELIELPSKKTTFYGENFYSDVLEKIRIFEGAPADYLISFDYDSILYSPEVNGNVTNLFESCKNHNISLNYSNHNLTETEKSLLLEYFSYLPPKMQSCFKEKVYAVYFIDGMWYGGLTDFIFDENQKMYCVMYLNADIFYKTLSDWLEQRDNTIFIQTDENNKIKTECSDDYKALLHVLLHETAHVYDYVNQITPYMDFFDGQEKSDSVYYNFWASKSQPVKKYNHKDLSAFSYYYFGNQIPLKKAKGLINYLSKTPFSTLYGAKNFQDDFAETVTFYYLKKAFGINYKITYIEKDVEKATYDLAANQNTQVWDSLCKDLTGF